MQPKYASAFAQKGAKNLMDAGPAYLSGPDASFPIRIEKYRVSLSCIYILNQAQRQDDLAPGRYAFFDKYGELPVIARQKAGSLAGDMAACCYSPKRKLFEKRRALHIFPYFPKKSLDRRLVRCYNIPRGD